MSRDIFKLIYVSSATTPFTENELKDHLKDWRKNNAARGITGLLLYSEGNIIQLLEGEEKQVMEMYDIIESDRRHNGVIRLMAEHTSERDFPDWSMGFRKIDDPDNEEKLEGFSNLAERRELNDDELDNLSVKASVFIKTFRKTSNLGG